MQRVICIIQARNGSSRLPGKVLKELYGRPMLSHIIERLQACRKLDGLLVATTEREIDLPVAELARSLGTGVFCGDEDDVLSRYAGAAEQSEAEVVVRITGDCPLIDPATVDIVVDYFLNHQYDYVSAGVGSGFPRGLDTEVFTAEALLRAHALSSDRPSREHVTYYMYRHPEQFSIGRYQAPPDLMRPGWRLCVDEEADFQLIDEIYRRLYRPGVIIDIHDVVNLLDNEETLVKINSHVEQKKC